MCVTARAVSRLMTTCHQPPGTKTVSPGACSNVRGRSAGSASSRSKGKTCAHLVRVRVRVRVRVS